jgi:hypothetical protein
MTFEYLPTGCPAVALAGPATGDDEGMGVKRPPTATAAPRRRR